jgi:hypothetical protein
VLAHPGVAASTTRARPTVGTFTTSDPVRAAVEVSHARYAGGAGLATEEVDGYGVTWASQVTLLSTDDPAAAPTAAAVAAGGPILFLRDGRLDPQVSAEVQRLLRRPHGLHKGVHVDVVASPGAVPASVTTDLESLGLRVRQISAGDAVRAAAATQPGRYYSYVVASQQDLPAVVAAAGVSSSPDTGLRPLLLTDGTTMSAASAARLDRIMHSSDAPATVYAVGSAAQAAVRSSWAGKRPFRIVDVGGSDPATTSLAAVEQLYDSPDRVSVTTSADWRSLLVAGMVGPTLVVDPGTGPSSATRAWLAASGAAYRASYVFGGTPGLARRVGADVYGTHYDVRRTPTDIPQ